MAGTTLIARAGARIAALVGRRQARRPSLAAIQAFVPQLVIPGRGVVAPVPAPPAAPAPAGFPSRRRRLRTLAVTAAVAVPCATGLALLLMASGTRLALRPPLQPATRAVPGPDRREQLRHLRVVCDQLNLETRTVGERMFVYAAGAAQVQSALAFARDTSPDLRPPVVALPVLAERIRQAFVGNGFEITGDPAPSDGLGITLTVHVPAVLEPLHQAVLAGIRTALSRSPALAPVHLSETVVSDGEPFLLAILVGRPSSMAFTADGPRRVGDTVLGHFKIRSIEQDRIELSRDNTGASTDAILTIPLHGKATLVSGPVNAADIPDLRSAIQD